MNEELNPEVEHYPDGDRCVYLRGVMIYDPIKDYEERGLENRIYQRLCQAMNQEPS